MGRRKPRRSTAVRTSAVSGETPAPEVSGRQLNLAQEYHYVITDLQRTGIIAGVLILGLVILSFVLR